jgi:hypothetical protein
MEAEVCIEALDEVVVEQEAVVEEEEERRVCWPALSLASSCLAAVPAPEVAAVVVGSCEWSAETSACRRRGAVPHGQDGQVGGGGRKAAAAHLQPLH